MRSVLLIGNGINLSFSDTKDKVCDLLSGKNNPNSDTIKIPEGVHVPFPLEVVIQTRDQVDLLMKNCSADLWGEVKTGSEQYDFYRRILNLPCEDILTSNYGFQLEETAYDTEIISKYKVGNITHFIKGRGRDRAESSLFTYTYQSAGEKYNNKRLWHIHGHAKNPSSMVIGHGYYGRLLYKLIDYVKDNDGRYRFGLNDIPEIRSWIDSFLFGDVYVLGFGFGFAEMDLWWLLDQKKNGNYGREMGKLYFYEPSNQNASDDFIKYEMLKSYGAEVLNLGVTVTHENEKYVYKEFYLKAINDIEERISKQ